MVNVEVQVLDDDLLKLRIAPDTNRLYWVVKAGQYVLSQPRQP
jgi:hypothetical protein